MNKMLQKEFRAYLVEEQNGVFTGQLKNRSINDLPPGDLLIKVHYSSLNYKDALSASGNKGVTKSYPHTPGIDAVGTVLVSNTMKFQIDDQVIVTSYDLGMNTDGGFGEYIRVPAGWALKLPLNMSMKEAMIFGTAGLTAGMSVQNLIGIVKPADGKIVVSGATGGVGVIAISILNKLGYDVRAITGKETEVDYLLKLGAKDIILRKDFENLLNKPLLKPLFAGGIDTVGGVILENIIKSTLPGGAVTCCGNVASSNLELTVFPFILRGITLIGIDSQNYPMIHREKVWNKLANEWKPVQLDEMYNEISPEELPEKIESMLIGKLKGRTVLKILQ
jgi:acrylyl-CoA reductase (NADPH)